MDSEEAAAVGEGTTTVPAALIQALILDDSAVDRRRLRRLCRDADVAIAFTEVGNIADFAAKIDQMSFDLFFIDYRLVQGDGLIALEMLRRHPSQQSAASIMVAGEGQIQVAIDALKCGCSDFLLKDMMGPEMLSRAVAHALDSKRERTTSHSENPDGALSTALSRFALSSGAEMRSILSSMLRRTRALKHQAAASYPLKAEDFAAIDASCTRLWEFLEEYQAFVADLTEAPRRLH